MYWGTTDRSMPAPNRYDGGRKAQRHPDRRAKDEADREGPEERGDEHQTSSPWLAGGVWPKPRKRAREKKASETGMISVTT